MMLCDAAPASLQPVNTYCVPGPPAWGVATERTCDPCDRFSDCGAVCAAPPSTLNCRPGGLVCTVIPVSAEKLAVTVCGPLMVTLVELLLELATLPLQPANEYPLLAVALTGTSAPAS